MTVDPSQPNSISKAIEMMTRLNKIWNGTDLDNMDDFNIHIMYNKVDHACTYLKYL